VIGLMPRAAEPHTDLMNMITIEKSSPTSADSQALIEQLSAELAAITGA